MPKIEMFLPSFLPAPLPGSGPPGGHSRYRPWCPPYRSPGSHPGQRDFPEGKGLPESCTGSILSILRKISSWKKPFFNTAGRDFPEGKGLPESCRSPEGAGDSPGRRGFPPAPKCQGGGRCGKHPGGIPVPDPVGNTGGTNPEPSLLLGRSRTWPIEATTS